MASASLRMDKDAADDLREIKARLSRGGARVPTLSDAIRQLAALWRESRPGAGAA
jgi:hypothetical protein